ncbi:MAG: hypothetical protein ABIF10_00250 [Candidatus Woesearchaeota archaeon]
MKKGSVANIIGAVIMIALFFVVGTLLFSRTSRDITRDYRSSEQIFLDESYSNSLNTVLEVDEPVTGEQMSRLVAKRIFYREEVLDVDGVAVNITEEFKNLLDRVYGEDSYFVEVKALIYDLTLIFVFDGSNSMVEERGVLAQALPAIIENLKVQTNLTVAERIYVLADKTSRSGRQLCDDFIDRDLSCEVIDYTDIYLPFPQQCADASHPNDDYRAKYCIIAPFTHNSWERQNRQASWQVGSRRDRENYYSVDWGAGITYALHKTSVALSNINILFPISEELSTSSFNQDCYTDFSDGQNNYRAITCDICEISNDQPTIERASRSIEAALAMSDDILNDVIFPIYSYQDPCEYLYKEYNRAACIEYALGTPPADGTWCGTSQCPGCQDTGSRPGDDYVCLHPEVTDIILSHMSELSDATGGEVVMLADKDRLADAVAMNVQDTLDSLFFTVGNKQNRSTYGFERLLTLPGQQGNFARLRLWKYV